MRSRRHAQGSLAAAEQNETNQPVSTRQTVIGFGLLVLLVIVIMQLAMLGTGRTEAWRAVQDAGYVGAYTVESDRMWPFQGEGTCKGWLDTDRFVVRAIRESDHKDVLIEVCMSSFYLWRVELSDPVVDEDPAP